MAGSVQARSRVAGVSQAWSLWWPPVELARRWAGYSQETAYQAIARRAEMGDRLAQVEKPESQLARVVAELGEEPEEEVVRRLARWLVKGRWVDVDA